MVSAHFRTKILQFMKHNYFELEGAFRANMEHSCFHEYCTLRSVIQAHKIVNTKKNKLLEFQKNEFISDGVYRMYSIKLLQKGICDLQTIQILQIQMPTLNITTRIQWYGCRAHRLLTCTIERAVRISIKC